MEVGIARGVKQKKAMKTLSELAGEHAALFERKQFERDGKKFSRVIIKRDYEGEMNGTATESALHKSCVDLTFKVSQATSLDSDSVYEFTQAALDCIAEANTDDRDEAFDHLQEIEPDVYTSQLTEWLNRSNNNAYYLTEAIENGAKDGFDALAWAQKAAIDEVNYIVLGYIETLRDEQDDDASDNYEFEAGETMREIERERGIK